MNKNRYIVVIRIDEICEFFSFKTKKGRDLFIKDLKIKYPKIKYAFTEQNYV